ncbi:MAG: aminomethyl transferase family protein [Candidatus Rokubacteria bacterium]|nr:aminomethyl transferase family protein [Candidatus Rokubacteria bacterium]
MPEALPLADVHRAEGARIEEIAGWSLAADYGDAAAEHRAAMQAAGVADRSHLGTAVVTGRDRAAFLQGMLSNDVKALGPGQGCPAAFLDAHGKVMALLHVYALEDRLLLEFPPGLTAKTLERLDRFLISEKAYFEATDGAHAIFALAGPRSAAILAEVTGGAIALADHAHAERVIADAPVRIIRRAEAPVAGFYCWTPVAHGAAVWTALRAAGAAAVGATAVDVLRVEAGVPWFGQDVDETVLLPETRLEHLVSYTKGCYIGQELVARVKYRGHVNRALGGLVIEGDGIPPPGARVTGADDKERGSAGAMSGPPQMATGRITSAVRSLTLGKTIALGYLRREHLEPGTPLLVVAGERRWHARAAALPFVQLA